MQMQIKKINNINLFAKNAVALATAFAFVVSASPLETYANQKQINPTIRQNAPHTNPDFTLHGYRSTSFGMNQEQVIQAIQDDFGLTEEQIKKEVHPNSKTPILSIKANNLLPNSGQAIISYVFGYVSKELIQINISWHESEELNAKSLLKISAALQNYLRNIGFNTEMIETAIPVNDDQLILLRTALQSYLLSLHVHPVTQVVQMDCQFHKHSHFYIYK